MLADRLLELNEALRLETRVPDSCNTLRPVHQAPGVDAVCPSPGSPNITASDVDHLDPGPPLRSPAGPSPGPPHPDSRLRTFSQQGTRITTCDFFLHTEYLPRRRKVTPVTSEVFWVGLSWVWTCFTAQRSLLPRAAGLALARGIGSQRALSKEWSGPTQLPKRFRLFLLGQIRRVGPGFTPWHVSRKCFAMGCCDTFAGRLCMFCLPGLSSSLIEQMWCPTNLVGHGNYSPAGHPERAVRHLVCFLAHLMSACLILSLDPCFNAACVFGPSVATTCSLAVYGIHLLVYTRLVFCKSHINAVSFGNRS